MMGPASGGLQALTLRRKLRKGVGYSGTPWSGQAVNWNWRTSLRSLLPLWLGKTGWLFVHSACLFCMIEYYNTKPTYQVVKRSRHVCKFVRVRSPGYIYINNDSVLISASQTSRDTTFIQTERSPVYWRRWIFHVHYSRDCAMDPLTWRFTTHQQKFRGGALDLEVTVGLVSAFVSRPRETRSSAARRLALRRKKVLCLQQWSYLSRWHGEPGLVWTHKSILRHVPTCVTLMMVEKNDDYSGRSCLPTYANCKRGHPETRWGAPVCVFLAVGTITRTVKRIEAQSSTKPFNWTAVPIYKQGRGMD